MKKRRVWCSGSLIFRLCPFPKQDAPRSFLTKCVEHHFTDLGNRNGWWKDHSPTVQHHQPLHLFSNPAWWWNHPYNNHHQHLWCLLLHIPRRRTCTDEDRERIFEIILCIIHFEICEGSAADDRWTHLNHGLPVSIMHSPKLRSVTDHTPFSLPISNIICQTSRMRNLTATLCLTLAVHHEGLFQRNWSYPDS